jgi:hypothetical protein
MEELAFFLASVRDSLMHWLRQIGANK